MGAVEAKKMEKCEKYGNWFSLHFLPSIYRFHHLAPFTQHSATHFRDFSFSLSLFSCLHVPLPSRISWIDYRKELWEAQFGISANYSLLNWSAFLSFLQLKNRDGQECGNSRHGNLLSSHLHPAGTKILDFFSFSFWFFWTQVESKHLKTSHACLKSVKVILFVLMVLFLVWFWLFLGFRKKNLRLRNDLRWQKKCFSRSMCMSVCLCFISFVGYFFLGFRIL